MNRIASFCPPHVFDQITDILADLALADLQQYPQIPRSQPIDSVLQSGKYFADHTERR